MEQQDEGPFFTADTMHIPLPDPMSAFDLQTIRQEEQPSQNSVLTLGVLSCNVNSFKDSKRTEGITWSARAELIKQQALDTQAQVVAWQETRRATGGMWQDRSFVGFEQPAVKGKGGVALWFRKDVPITKHTPTRDASYFIANNFSVVYAMSELIIVKYMSPDWKAIFVSAHAPTELAGQGEKDTFWTLLHSQLASYDNWDVIIGFDANSRLGDDALPHAGDFAADLPNDNGYRMLNFLRRHDLGLPSTFKEFVKDAEQPQGTWLAKNGWKRIDYVCIPLKWINAAGIQTETLPMEKEVEQDDHSAVHLELIVPILAPGSKPAIRHLKPALHGEQLLTTKGREVCKDVLRQLKQDLPPWTAAADLHATYLQEHTTALLKHNMTRPRRATKPTWIQMDTWDTIAMSRRSRHQLQKLKDLFRNGTLRVIFQAWKQQQQVPSGCYARWIQEHDVATAKQLHLLRTSRSKRAICLQRDQSSHLATIASKQKEDFSEAKGTELWKQLRFQLPKYRNKIKRPLPHTTAHDAFLTHFAEIEDAQVSSIDHLAIASVQGSQQGLSASLNIQMYAVDLPTIFELEDAIRAVASRKSSLGAFQVELMKADPATTAEILMPLMIDFFRHFQQPITWKGGSYFPLFKGKGSYSVPGNYRAILIAHAVPKLFHRIVRARLSTHVAPRLMPFQIGGVKQMSVHFAAQFLGALRTRANIRKRSSAVLFFDLRSAFYRAQRSRIVGDVLHYQRDDDEDITLDQLEKPPALSDMNVPLSLQGAVQEIFTNSWNTVIAAGQETDDQVMESKRGTRPGDPIADLAFTCTMRSALQQFMEDAQDVLPQLDVGTPQQTVPAITWVDDVAIFLDADEAEDLVNRAKQVVMIMHKKCRSHGLDLNYAKGKTEVMFRFHGRDAVRWRKQMHLEPKMCLGDGFWQSIEVPISTKYTHLGVVHTASASMEAELAYRLGRARAALRECAKPVLRQKAISPSTRWQLAKSLILSRLFFAAELWPTLSSVNAAKVNNFMMKVARIILNCENFVGMEHYTDQYVEAQLPIPPLQAVLTAARLRYWARMWHFGPEVLKQLMLQLEAEDNDSWLRNIKVDMVWLQNRVPNLKHLPSPEVDWEPWIQKTKSLTEWNAMINQAVQSTTLHRHYQAKHAQWKKQWQATLEVVGLSFVEAAKPSPMTNFACSMCEARFCTYKDLSVHQYKQHGRHAAERAYMEGTVCFSCLKEFHSTQRLRQHLQWKPDRCLRHLQQTMWPLPYTDVPIKESLRTAHRVPAFRMPGPVMPDITTWREVKPEKVFPADVEEDGQQVGEEESDGVWVAEPNHPPNYDYVVQDGHLALIVEKALSGEMPWNPPHKDWWSLPEAYPTLVAFAEYLQDEVVNQVDFEKYYEIFQWTENILTLHFRARRKPMDTVDHEIRQGVPLKHSKTSTQRPPLQVEYRPIEVERALPGTADTHYVLYAYAGHRREGDMVEWAEKFGRQHNMRLAVVTLDIVYHEKLCNLRDGDAQALWCQHLRERRFIAAIGAPPCETWSVARHRAWLEQDGGPPPVRSSSEPWGMKNISARLQAQVDCANDLMHIWLTFLVLSIQTATPCLMEHPAPSLLCELAASIWRTEEMQWVKLVDKVKEILIFQGRFGAVAAKPTHLLVFDLPHLEGCLKRWEDASGSAKPWIALKGRAADGSFLTAMAKAYPSNLNAAIVEAIVLGVKEHPDRLLKTTAAPPKPFLAHVEAVHEAQKVSGTEMGPDFAQL